MVLLYGSSVKVNMEPELSEPIDHFEPDATSASDILLDEPWAESEATEFALDTDSAQFEDTAMHMDETPLELPGPEKNGLRFEQPVPNEDQTTIEQTVPDASGQQINDYTLYSDEQGHNDRALEWNRSEQPADSVLLDQGNTILDDAPANILPQDALSSGLGYCEMETPGVTMWGIAFHLALFATFFSLFFQFVLRGRYEDTQSDINQTFALLAQASVPMKTRAVIEQKMPELAARAVAAQEKRTKRNEAMMLWSMLPVAIIWIVVIIWGRRLRSHGEHIANTIKGAMGLFVIFLVAELVIFKTVVTQYKPLDVHSIVGIYQEQMRKEIDRCSYQESISLSAPIVPIVKSMM